MASLKFELGEFPQGYFLAWEVATQCYNMVNVSLEAGDMVYFSADKNNRNCNLQQISQSSREHTVNAVPVLTITVNESPLLKQSFTSGAVTDQKSKKIGYSYSFCIEDSTDDEYNDVYINIVGWEKKA